MEGFVNRTLQPVIDNMNDVRTIRIGHSPDPDDAFMFHALTTAAFDTPGLHYVHQLQDIETLNQRAMNGELEVSAVSIHAYPEIADNYSLMNCGASMGEGYGPMVVALPDITVEMAKKEVIAIPGLKTSAYLGLRLCWGEVEIEVVPFDEIIPRIISREYTSGLIIHEGQLTYAEHGLHVLEDLGVWWADRTGGLPMPLGGNVVKNDLGQDLITRVTEDTKKSIEFALSNPDDALEFAKEWGRGIDDSTNRRFVSMYVNQRTIDYGEQGRESVRLFLKEGQNLGLISSDFNVDSMRFIGSEED